MPSSHSAGPQNGRPKNSSIQKAAPATANFPASSIPRGLKNRSQRTIRPARTSNERMGKRPLSISCPVTSHSITLAAPKESDFHT